MKDKHGKVIYEPYRIKVLNTINFKTVSYTHLDVYKRQGYEKALDSQANGQIKILSHARVRNGDLFYDHKEQIR